MIDMYHALVKCKTNSILISPMCHMNDLSDNILCCACGSLDGGNKSMTLFWCSYWKTTVSSRISYEHMQFKFHVTDFFFITYQVNFCRNVEQSIVVLSHVHSLNIAWVTPDLISRSCWKLYRDVTECHGGYSITMCIFEEAEVCFWSVHRDISYHTSLCIHKLLYHVKPIVYFNCGPGNRE